MRIRKTRARFCFHYWFCQGLQAAKIVQLPMRAVVFIFMWLLRDVQRPLSGLQFQHLCQFNEPTNFNFACRLSRINEDIVTFDHVFFALFVQHGVEVLVQR